MKLKNRMYQKLEYTLKAATTIHLIFVSATLIMIISTADL